MTVLPVYDVVLLPSPQVEDASIALSKRLAGIAPVEFILSRHKLYPHISLFMANLTPEAVEKATIFLASYAHTAPALRLKAQRFAISDHGMCEVFYDKPDELVKLQQYVLEVVAPLRTGLREWDPVGRILSHYSETADEPARSNLERYGYDEVGELFKPHITLTRFKQWGFALSSVPSELLRTSVFDDCLTTLALCEMGEHGTCTRVVASWQLTGVLR